MVGPAQENEDCVCLRVFGLMGAADQSCVTARGGPSFIPPTPPPCSSLRETSPALAELCIYDGRRRIYKSGWTIGRREDEELAGGASIALGYTASTDS